MGEEDGDRPEKVWSGQIRAADFLRQLCILLQQQGAPHQMLRRLLGGCHRVLGRICQGDWPFLPLAAGGKGEGAGELIGQLSLSLRANRACMIDQTWEEPESPQHHARVHGNHKPSSAAISRSPVGGSGHDRWRKAWPLWVEDSPNPPAI